MDTKSLKPGDLTKRFNRLLAHHQFDAVLREASSIAPTHPCYFEAQTWLPLVHLRQNRLQQAMDAVDATLQAYPNSPALLCTKAVIHGFMDQRAASFSFYQQARAALETSWREKRITEADYERQRARIEFNMALHRLGLMQFEAFEGYEHRFEAHDNLKRAAYGETDLPPQFMDYPWWRGEDLRGKRLVVWSEQGLGDNLFGARFLPLVKRATGAASVRFSCRPPLVRLMQGLEVDVVSDHELLDPASYDYHVPLMSLPLRLGLTRDTIPVKTPYLHARPADVKAWREQLRMVPGLKVGLVWAGNPHLTYDKLRSVSLEQLAPLAKIPGVSFISLQMGARDLNAHGFHLLDAISACKDFADTAALVSQLDLVIGVDTSTIHVAGAMGVPVWMLNRIGCDWRWGFEGEDCFWYPTLRQYRQERAASYAEPIARIEAALRAHPQRREHGGLQDLDEAAWLALRDDFMLRLQRMQTAPKKSFFARWFSNDDPF
ncbi:hypothetical protein [Massilia sp. TS11]|uniref:hypothetical protein n=1 Tax=Massilia sp. TS11 TaxID=2908003 RepID=UPI001ED9CE16|nr:hypothetical protein [Massilia sp. TS11]MCG2584587.1 hypothetical protein [Massilia sp. TS11]